MAQEAGLLGGDESGAWPSDEFASSEGGAEPFPSRLLSEQSNGSLSASLELGCPDLQPLDAGAGRRPSSLLAMGSCGSSPVSCSLMPSPTHVTLLCPSRLDQSQRPAPLWWAQKDRVI